MQEKYWKYMVQIKAWIFYLDVYTEDSYRWDRIINIVVAIASSTSIAAWAIWQKYSFVWSIIENKNLKEETLLEKDNFRKIADRKNDAYFANNF